MTNFLEAIYVAICWWTSESKRYRCKSGDLTDTELLGLVGDKNEQLTRLQDQLSISGRFGWHLWKIMACAVWVQFWTNIGKLTRPILLCCTFLAAKHLCHRHSTVEKPAKLSSRYKLHHNKLRERQTNPLRKEIGFLFKLLKIEIICQQPVSMTAHCVTCKGNCILDINNQCLGSLFSCLRQWYVSLRPRKKSHYRQRTSFESSDFLTS